MASEQYKNVFTGWDVYVQNTCKRMAANAGKSHGLTLNKGAIKEELWI